MDAPKTRPLKTWIVEAESSITGAIITVDHIRAPSENAAWLEIIGPRPWDARQRARRARYMIRPA